MAQVCTFKSFFHLLPKAAFCGAMRNNVVYKDIIQSARRLEHHLMALFMALFANAHHSSLHLSDFMADRLGRSFFGNNNNSGNSGARSGVGRMAGMVGWYGVVWQDGRNCKAAEEQH